MTDRDRIKRLYDALDALYLATAQLPTDVALCPAKVDARARVAFTTARAVLKEERSANA